MPELWTPGTSGPLDELVERIVRRIEAFRTEHGLEQAGVSVELADGSLHRLASLSAEPGFGFVTLCPHCDDGEPTELIVPLGCDQGDPDRRRRERAAGSVSRLRAA